MQKALTHLLPRFPLRPILSAQILVWHLARLSFILLTLHTRWQERRRSQVDIRGSCCSCQGCRGRAPVPRAQPGRCLSGWLARFCLYLLCAYVLLFYIYFKGVGKIWLSLSHSLSLGNLTKYNVGLCRRHHRCCCGSRESQQFRRV